MIYFLVFLVKVLWLILPGVLANMAPVLTKKIRFLAIPVDFGKTFRGQPIFGKNKTWRGIFFGILASLLVVFGQSWLFHRFLSFRQISFINFDQISFFWVGFLIGGGVLFGDLAKSFVKRQLKIPPGAKFIPWDQLAALFGALIFMSIVYLPPWPVILTLFLLIPPLHILINFISFWLGLQKTKW